MKILITGAAGFIGGYLVREFLNTGHSVIGIDNYSKYGKLSRSYDNDVNYSFVKGDAKNVKLLKKLIIDCDYAIALAAKIGGISYFHALAYDLLAENERITASFFDAAIEAFLKKRLKKVIIVSSSMVFESAKIFPTPESILPSTCPPRTTYGFQKLATEYFAQGAWEQYKLPYTIVRPFNCVGVGETKAIGIEKNLKGNYAMAMRHVVPDLVYKILIGQNPVHILGDGKQIRHYTYGADLAKGIRMATFSKKAINEDFNLSSEISTTVLELAKIIWSKINPNKKFSYISDKPFKYDVRKRIPDVSKAKKILGFEAKTGLDEMLNEIIPWIKKQIETGKL